MQRRTYCRGCFTQTFKTSLIWLWDFRDHHESLWSIDTHKYTCGNTCEFITHGSGSPISHGSAQVRVGVYSDMGKPASYLHNGVLHHPSLLNAQCSSSVRILGSQYIYIYISPSESLMCVFRFLFCSLELHSLTLATHVNHKLGDTSSGSESSPGNGTNWILMIATCGVWPSSKYSNSHTGVSSNTAKSFIVSTLAIVPRYTIAHSGACSSMTRRGVLREIGNRGASAVDGGQSMPLERTTWAVVCDFVGNSCGIC